MRVDKEVRGLDEEIVLDKKYKHDIDVVIDRLVMKEGVRTRLADSVETALRLADGTVVVAVVGGDELPFSQALACPVHGSISMPELAPRDFSFNSPYGACPDCNGLGSRLEPDPAARGARHLADACRGSDRAVQPRHELLPAARGGRSAPHRRRRRHAVGGAARRRRRTRCSTGSATRASEWTTSRATAGRRTGTRATRARSPRPMRRFEESESENVKDKLQEYMAVIPCKTCGGARLKKEILAVTVNDRNVHDVTVLSAKDSLAFFEGLELTDREEQIARRVVKEIVERLRFLVDVGLDYLTLERATATLSGGEAQRIRLATQIGAGLMGVLYILDEPSIGLHQRDNARLIATMERLRDLGNTVIVVEHDEETIRAADFVVDMGPGAGEHGGEIVCIGPPEVILACEDSLTAAYLSGRREIDMPEKRRDPRKGAVRLRGCRRAQPQGHRRRHRDRHVHRHHRRVGLGQELACGRHARARHGEPALPHPQAHRRVPFDRGARAHRQGRRHRPVPIGRTPRSNPATYTGVWDDVRALFSSTPEAKLRGYSPGRFSFNVAGGRCEACKGDGQIKIEMHFLPDVYVPCEVCKGARYNRETLQVTYHGKTVSDILDMTVEEALHFFENIPPIRRKLQTLYDVGLGYIRMGQPATTLSGGEAQRVKLASELQRRSTGRTFYILDEPTTGLHFDDVRQLLIVLQRLVDGGNTVLVIEHNLDVIKSADRIIDLGPEGGDRGGYIIVSGTPEDVVACEESHTGRFLAPVLQGRAATAAPELGDGHGVANKPGKARAKRGAPRAV